MGRAAKSACPPGGKGTIIIIFRVGQVVWPTADMPINGSAAGGTAIHIAFRRKCRRSIYFYILIDDKSRLVMTNNAQMNSGRSSTITDGRLPRKVLCGHQYIRCGSLADKPSRAKID